MESQALYDNFLPLTTDSGKELGVGDFERGLTENVNCSSKRVWRAASPLPIYRKSPCGAEGGEKAGFPQELDDGIFIKLIYSILRFQKSYPENVTPRLPRITAEGTGVTMIKL